MVDRRSVPVFQQEPILVLLLSFLTCGLYLIYWNIKAAEVLNAVSDRQVISPAVAVNDHASGVVDRPSGAESPR